MLLLIVETMKINGAVVITIIFMSVRYFIVANELKRGRVFHLDNSKIFELDIYCESVAFGPVKPYDFWMHNNECSRLNKK